jgi:hypothetical protein
MVPLLGCGVEGETLTIRHSMTMAGSAHPTLRQLARRNRGANRAVGIAADDQARTETWNRQRIHNAVAFTANVRYRPWPLVPPVNISFDHFAAECNLLAMS